MENLLVGDIPMRKQSNINLTKLQSRPNACAHLHTKGKLSSWLEVLDYGFMNTIRVSILVLPNVQIFNIIDIVTLCVYLKIRRKNILKDVFFIKQLTINDALCSMFRLNNSFE